MSGQYITPTRATQQLKQALRSAGIAFSRVVTTVETSGVVSQVYIRDNDTQTMGLAVHAINRQTSASQAKRAGSSNLIDVEW